MRYWIGFAMAVGMTTLASCGQSPPLTAAEDQRIDQAMARVKAEQDRTDRAESQKRTIAYERLSKPSSDAAPASKMRIRPIQPVVVRDHVPAEIRTASPRGTAEPPRTRN